MKIVHFIAKNSWFNLLVGSVCVSIGIFESIEEIENLFELEFSSHHGVLLLGITHCFSSLHNIIEGLDHFEKT